MSKILDHLTHDDTTRWNRSLSAVFGPEWLALSALDRLLIIKDCTVEGGVSDVQEYRQNIGAGNLASYANVMRVRFR